MDISKYITNKDIQLSNDDINIEKLEKDIRKGYVSSDEVEKVRKDTIKENTAILQNCGVNVIYKSDFHQKFTVIDNKIVWYGSVNFLSFGTNEESIMRFVSFDIAGELTDTVI